MASELQSKNVELGSARKGIKKCLKLSLPIIFNGDNLDDLKSSFLLKFGPTLFKIPKTVHATNILTR